MGPENIPVWRGRAPKPANASVVARRLIDLANRVPAGKWVSYGDLAEAYKAAHGENTVARGVASALSLTPPRRRDHLDDQSEVDKWYVPWHRIRLADGRSIERIHGVQPADNPINRMLVAEGGNVRHGAATDSCRFNLIGALKGDDSLAVTSARPLTDEQPARLAARAQERRKRLNG